VAGAFRPESSVEGAVDADPAVPEVEVPVVSGVEPCGEESSWDGKRQYPRFTFRALRMHLPKSEFGFSSSLPRSAGSINRYPSQLTLHVVGAPDSEQTISQMLDFQLDPKSTRSAVHGDVRF
jgi:hypothetical protein